MITLDALSRTALTPFWARVSDTRLEFPILNDTVAARLATAMEQRFGRIAVDESTRTGCCLRNLFADQWVTRLATRDTTVVDIGVGLDTRLMRLRLSVGRYIEVDSPEVIALRNELLPGTPAIRVCGDGLNIREWATEPPMRTSNTIIVLEGVLTYHEPSRVHWFLAELASILPGAFIIFDSLSPLSAWMANRPHARQDERPEYRWSVWTTRRIPVDTQRLSIIGEQGLLEFPRRYTQAFGMMCRLPFFRRSYRLTAARLPVGVA